MARSGRGSKLPPDEPVLFDLPLVSHDTSGSFDSRTSQQRSEPRPDPVTKSAAKTTAPMPGDLLPFDAPEPASRYPQAVPSRPTMGTPIEPDDERDPAADLSVFPSGRERWVAGAADLIVHAAVLVVALIGVRALGIHPAFAHAAPFGLFLAAFSFLYTVIPLAFWGQTLGMGWMRTIARDRDGQALTFDQTARRWLGGLIAAALLGLPVWLALRGRSLTDWLSGSITLRANGALDGDADYGAA